VVEQLRSEFPSSSFSFERVDVSSWESQAAAFENVVAQQGRVDVVFANAGITEKGSLLPEKDGKLTRPELATINVNFVGVLYSKSYRSWLVKTGGSNVKEKKKREEKFL
jgi:NAD(P)-dependent dehydrogenase (short-subunit alcohol dehydrogenase family)